MPGPDSMPAPSEAMAELSVSWPQAETHSATDPVVIKVFEPLPKYALGLGRVLFGSWKISRTSPRLFRNTDMMPFSFLQCI